MPICGLVPSIGRGLIGAYEFCWYYRGVEREEGRGNGDGYDVEDAKFLSLTLIVDKRDISGGLMSGGGGLNTGEQRSGTNFVFLYVVVCIMTFCVWYIFTINFDIVEGMEKHG